MTAIGGLPTSAVMPGATRAWALLLLALLSGCDDAEHATPTLTVFAAASLTDAFEAL